MNDLHQALSQISQIHDHLVRTEIYRGLRSIPIAMVGGIAFAAAIFEEAYPEQSPQEFVFFWSVVAVVCFGIAISGGVILLARPSLPFQRTQTLLILRQFLPCLLVGLTVTLAFWKAGEDTFAYLPGLWSLIFCLGSFATTPYLPSGIGWIALGYLIAGIVLLQLAPSGASLSPWAMGITFGGGHFATAAVLYWSLERRENHESR